MGAVSFVQRFGSTLNAHVHFHCWVIDGVFVAGADGQVQFAEAAALRPEDLAAAAAAGAATGAALVRPCQPSRCCRCARHGELGSRRRLFAGCFDPRRRPRPRRPGTAAALLRAAARCAGAPRAARRGCAHLSLRPAAARWAYPVAADTSAIDRASGRADPAPRACTATAITGCWTEFTSPDDSFRAWSSDHSMSQSGRFLPVARRSKIRKKRTIA